MSDKDPFFEPEKNVKDQRTFLHDLSNPLSIALGMLEIAMDQISKIENLDEKTKKCLDKSLNGMHRMKDLIKSRREILIEKTPESKDDAA